MRVAEHHEFETRVVPCRAICRSSQTESTVARAIRPAGMRASRCERRSDVGVNPPEGADGQSIPEDTPKGPISPVLMRTKAIAVLDPRSPAGEIAFPGAKSIVDPKLLRQYIAPPAVVISSDHEHRNALGEIG